MRSKKRYEKPVLVRYKKVDKVTEASVALEGTAQPADCTLLRCSGSPPSVKG